jgi:LCP family protein required for cell wall assembly
MSDDRPEDEKPPEEKEGDGEDSGETELPPPATWAGKRSSEEEEADEADEGVGRGITDEFALSDEVPPSPDEPPGTEEPAPPVEEPPDPEAPEPVEEPPAPGAPPSGSTEEFVPREVVPVSDEFDEVQPVTHRYEPGDSEEFEEVDDEPQDAGSDPEGRSEAPQPEGSDPKGSEDEPQPEGSDPKGSEDEPQPEGSDPKGSEDEPEAEEKPESEEQPEAAKEPPPEEPEKDPVTVVKQPPPVLVAAEKDKEKKTEKADKAPRAGLWPRFIAASFVIVLSMATATAASLLLYLNDIAQAIGAKLPGVEDVLETVEGGEPQTVLILGSDIRPEIEKKGRSDTTMLLRLDADKNVLSLLSLPRDLQVNIPGYGTGKLNEAYTVGGPKRTLETVKNLTGLEINHVVNINFSGFAKAVDAIECVFVDVDRDYFISNEGVFDDSQKISEIDIDAGYQQLCGFKALQYVRFRHDDNDLVRAARQQSFLREARQKVPPERLFEKRGEFIDIFTKYTTSDINDPIAMLDTLKLFIELRDAPVRRIQFQGDIGDATSTYVTASDEQIKTAVQQFLGEKPAPADEPKIGRGGGGGGDGGGGRGGGGDGGGGGNGGSEAPSTELIDASDAASRYALEFDGRLRFPVYAPVQLVPGSEYSDDSRAYSIDTYDGEHYPAYKLVFPLQGEFGVPEYYGAMGTKWRDAPILENPSETRKMGDREYLLFFEGSQLQVVGWKTKDAAYWVSNTLTGDLTEDQMIAVAESMEPFSPGR